MEENKYIPDCIFPTDNDAEIPALRMDRQPSFCDIPFVCFGEQKRTFQMRGQGTLHFYTDDYRFSSVYEHPEKILQHDPRNIVEPNFSLFSEIPVAFGLQAIYKKRFIARAMQEKGISVFVDLNVNSKFYKLNMLGVPRGYSAYCTRGYSDRLHYLEYEWKIAKEWSDGNELLFVIYGGGIECKRFAKLHKCVYVSQIVSHIKKTADALKKIDSTVAFLGEEFGVNKMLTRGIEDRFSGQLNDFTGSLLIKNKN